MIFKTILQTIAVIFGSNTIRQGRDARLASGCKIVRLPAKPRAKVGGQIVAKWRRNPVSGQLECRWTVSGAGKMLDAHDLPRHSARASSRSARL